MASKKLTKPALREADIERTCGAFLSLDGWRCIKTDPVSDRRRGKGFGELGMADCLYARYKPDFPDHRPDQLTTAELAAADLLWIEWKSARGKPKPHQLAWHQTERARGALTWIAGVDFPASIEGFMEFYRASGLLRRKGL